MKRSAVGLAVLGLMGCSEWQTGGNIGGANQGLKMPGNVPGGINLKNGDVAVAGLGQRFATMQDNDVVTGSWGDKEMQRLDAMPNAQRMLFWTSNLGEGLWAAKAQSGSMALVSYNSSEKQVAWQRTANVKPMSQDRFLIDVSPDGKYLVVTGQTIAILDAATGTDVASYSPEMQIRDVDMTADSQYMIVTESDIEYDTSGFPQTRVARVRLNNPASTDSCAATTNNCASELVMAENDTKAFLAPTLCHMDPVTVFTFTSSGCEMKKQMPGFGPVALAPDGKTAVAFLDRDAFERGTGMEVMQAPPEVANSADRYHLMFIDVTTLDYTTAAFGDDMPRYAFTPGGHELLVDAPMNPFLAIRRLNMDNMKWSNVKGPPVKMHSFSYSLDGTKVFVVDNGLFELDLGGMGLKPAALGLFPDSLNVTPDGETVLLSNLPRQRVHLVDAKRGTESGRISR